MINVAILSTCIRVCVGAVVLGALAGCAGTPSHSRGLEAGGVLRMETCEAGDCDYKVYVRNVHDFGWDLDVREDRLNTVRALFGGRCDAMEVLGESTIETGSYPFGRPARTYVMKIRCPAKR